MGRTISIRGIGKISIKPDMTVVSLNVRTVDKIYDKAMDKAGKALDSLRDSLAGIGFGDDALKTEAFNVGTEYESRPDKNGRYKNYFTGYSVSHRMKLEFGFDTELLSKTLGAISSCIAEPELNVQFTVRDKEEALKKLLADACADAREKALVLTKASGVMLGEIQSIDYSFSDTPMYSRTRYAVEDACMVKACGAAPNAISIAPDDIEVSDGVTVVWEIR